MGKPASSRSMLPGVSARRVGASGVQSQKGAWAATGLARKRATATPRCWCAHLGVAEPPPALARRTRGPGAPTSQSSVSSAAAAPLRRARPRRCRSSRRTSETGRVREARGGPKRPLRQSSASAHLLLVLQQSTQLRLAKAGLRGGLRRPAEARLRLRGAAAATAAACGRGGCVSHLASPWNWQWRLAACARSDLCRRCAQPRVAHLLSAASRAAFAARGAARVASVSPKSSRQQTVATVWAVVHLAGTRRESADEPHLLGLPGRRGLCARHGAERGARQMAGRGLPRH